MARIPFTAEVPQFQPRKRTGQDPNLPPIESAILDELDVLSQQTAFFGELSVKAYNMSLILVAVVGLAILANLPIGGSVLKALKSFFSP